MPWSDGVNPEAFTNLVGRTVSRVVGRTDYDPAADEPLADFLQVAIECEDGFSLLIEGTLNLEANAKVDALAPDDPGAIVTFPSTTSPPNASEQTGGEEGPDSPVGVAGCTCVDEPGEDPLCKIHGKDADANP